MWTPRWRTRARRGRSRRQLGVAEAIAEARLRQQVRALIHVLHAARDDDVGVARPDLGRASMIAFIPEPQTWLTVVALVDVREAGLERRLASGRLADAGLETWPMSTSSNGVVGTPARSTAARMAMPPRLVAGTSARRRRTCRWASGRPKRERRRRWGPGRAARPWPKICTGVPCHSPRHGGSAARGDRHRVGVGHRAGGGRRAAGG